MGQARGGRGGRRGRAIRNQAPDTGPGRVPIKRATPQTRLPVSCPHFGPCGGCQYLDLPYDEEIAGKARAFEELVRGRQSLAKVRILPPLAAAEPLFYRTALKVPFGFSPRGPTCGFFRRGTNSVVDLRACAVQHPLLTEILVRARELAASLRVPVYQSYNHRGLLRHLLARVAPGTGQALAGLVVRRGGAPQIRKMARALLAEFQPRGLVGVVENVNSEQTNVIVGKRTGHWCGERFLVEEQDGLRFRTSISSFAQVNSAQASVLYGEVLRQLGDMSGRRVCDLFSGYGPIALRVARNGAFVDAVEHNQEAVRNGSLAAEENGLGDRVRFFADDAVAGLRRLAGDDLEALVVDPPRRGLTPPLIDLLAGLPLRRMVYVSCNPETLVRDLDLLQRAFDVAEIQPVDLFPRTSHLEVVALLRRRGEFASG